MRRAKFFILFVVVSFFFGLLFFPVAARSQEPPIKIGLFGPMTGALSLLGLEARKGAEFALKEINAAGGVNGRKLELIIYDDRLDKAEAVSVANKLVGADKVVAAISGSASLTSIAASPVFNEGKTPLIVAYANAFNIVKGKPYAFRWASVADVQGYVMAKYAIQDKGYKKFALLIQDEEYGRGIGRGMEEGIKKWGGEVVFKQLFPPGEKEFRALLAKIKAVEPDAVFGSGFGIAHAPIVMQGTALGLFPKSQYFGSCTMGDLNWYTTVGKAGQGAIGILEFIRGVKDPKTLEFVAKWEKEFGTRIISHEAGLTYDATRLLADAIRRGGPTREGIKKALEETTSFVNLSGAVVKYSPIREPFLPLAIGQYDAENKIFNLLKYETDPDIIDPTRWAKYYE